MILERKTESSAAPRIAAGTVQVRNVELASGDLKAGAVLGRLTSGGAFALSASAASDGSQTPYVVLAHDADASSDPVEVTVIVAGPVKAEELILGAGHDLGEVAWALRDVGIIVKGV